MDAAKSGANTDLISITSSTALTLASAATSNVNLTPGTTGFVDIVKTASTGVRENILRAKVSDAGNDAFIIGNAFLTDSRFGPAFIGYADSNVATFPLFFRGLTSAAMDSGTAPLIIFQSARTSSATDPNNGTITDITTRPLFRFQSGTGVVSIEIPANGNVLIGTTTDPSLGKLHVAGAFSATGNIYLGKTVTAAATTGAQTINQPSGSVNFAAAATSLVVTNSLVTASSVIQCTVGTNDATMSAATAVAAAGSFTIRPNAAPTAETRVNFTLTN